ncbi:MAG: leucine-rich repeat domain-containing protein [Deinococcota bacterium]
MLLLASCGNGDDDDTILPPPDTEPPTIAMVMPTSDDVPVDTMINVRFSEAMDATSTTAAFTSVPPIVCDLTVNRDTLTCAPREQLPFNQNYSVTIETGASDVAGNSLVEARTFAFTTAAPDDAIAPTVTDARPASGSEDVARNSNILISFSEPMDVDATTAAFSSEPEISCTFSFNATNNRLLCDPVASFADNTEYVVQIDTSATDEAGNALASTFSFSFRTFSEVVIPDNTTPSIDSFVNPASAITEEEVTFEWQVSDADEDDALSCMLDPGDGSDRYQIADCLATTSQTHSYSIPGIYVPTLTVRDDSLAPNSSASFSSIIEITGENQRPSVQFLNFNEPEEDDDPQAFSFFAEAEDDGEVVRYDWDFGDGNSTTTTDPETMHVYTAPGIYLVTVTAVDDEDARASLTTTIDVVDGQIGEPCNRPGNILMFPDSSLEQAIRASLEAQNGAPVGENILCSDIASLLDLASEDSSIESLAGLEQAVSLQALSLPNSTISNLAPLAELTSLERINLNGNQLTDLSPLADLPNLTLLFVANNDISDLSPLARLSSLTRLDVGDNDFDSLEPLSGLTNLTQLGIYGNGLDNLAALSGLANLTLLSASDNMVSDISAITSLTELRVVSLSNNVIETLAGMEMLTKLETFFIRNNSISDIRPLNGIVTLRQLNLAGNQIIDISPVASLSGLDDLDISGNAVRDITPLVDNPGWTAGDDINIVDNCLFLDLGDPDFINLNILIGLGIEVTFGAQRECDPIVVTVTPSATNIDPGVLVELTAAIEGVPVSGVIWEAAEGTLVTNGNMAAFSAPETPGTYTVTVRAVADSSATAEATIIVIDPNAESEGETP